MPLRNWYNWGTKHFHRTSVVCWKWKTQLDRVIKPEPHDLVRRIRFWRIKSLEYDFKYLYWTIRKILFWNLFTCKGTYMMDWVGWHNWDTTYDSWLINIKCATTTYDSCNAQQHSAVSCICIHVYIYICEHIYICMHRHIRPTQSVMYVPLQVNIFAKNILLIPLIYLQYRYLKSCFGDFNSPESDPPHKIMC